MRVALVTGGSGLVGAALIRLLAGSGVRVLATARSRAGAAAVAEAGAEPLHTDLANLAAWEAETAPAEVIFHAALPRLDPPLRAPGAARRRRAAREGARALGRLAAGRPIVMASSGLVYGDRRAGPAADDDPAPGGPALGRVALAAERALPQDGLRVVRLPWVYGPGGFARDLIVGLRTRRHRIVGTGGNRWALLSAADAAAALRAAAAAPPGRYSAAEPDPPTQEEVVRAICAVPGHRFPDHVPRRLAALSMGGPMAEALSCSLAIRTGRLGELGWAPHRRWRSDLISLAEGSLPLPARAI